MNRNIISALLLSFVITCSFAQAGEKKTWLPITRYQFITECINSAKASMSTDTARFYCYCMQEKIEMKYPDTADMVKLTTAELSSPEWKKEVNACLNGTWPGPEREAFLKSCIEQARSLGETKARNYCECMLFKVEKLYPNATDLTNVTNETLKTEPWQKLIQGCLKF